MFLCRLMPAVGLLAWAGRAGAFAPRGASTPISSRASTFTRTSRAHHHHRHHSSRLRARVTFADADEATETSTVFDPLGCSDGWDGSSSITHCIDVGQSNSQPPMALPAKVAAPLLALSTMVIDPADSYAAIQLSEGDFNPDTFRPVCSASDSFYRFLQGTTRAAVGDDAFAQFGPLIAEGLLRIRLELCVVESYFNEAVGPFIEKNGLSWILPLHETVETFLAGTIFALATTFILLGSTKLVQLIAFYGDILIGGPCRLLGGFFFDRARGEPVTLDVSLFGFFKTRLVGPPVDFKEEARKKAIEGEKMIDFEQLLDFDKVQPAEIPLLVVSGGVKLVGEVSKIFREFIEALDLFVGRYLVVYASVYILLKFVHFKVFPNFP